MTAYHPMHSSSRAAIACARRSLNDTRLPGERPSERRSLRARLYAGFNAHAWDLRYLFSGRHWAVPADVMMHIGQPLSLLDVGCGRGYLLKTMRAKDWHGHYLGIDVSRCALSHAARIEDIDAGFMLCSIEDFDYGTGVWDRIVMTECIYYVNLAEMQREIAKYRGLLSGDGKILVRIHDHAKFRPWVTELQRAGATRVSEALLVLER